MRLFALFNILLLATLSTESNTQETQKTPENSPNSAIRLQIKPTRIQLDPGESILLFPQLLSGKTALPTWPDEFVYHISSGSLQGHRYAAPDHPGRFLITIGHPRVPDLLVRVEVEVPLPFTPREVRIEPESQTPHPGQSVLCRLLAYPPEGKPMEVPAIWSTKGPGSIDPATGIYQTPENRTRSQVILVAHGPGDIRATDTLSITEKVPSSQKLVIQPQNIRAEPGTRIVFQATLFVNNRPQTFEPWRLSWQADRGTFDGTSFLVPDGEGLIPIRATLHSNLHAQSTVEVIAPPRTPSRIVITPATAQIETGKTLLFHAQVLDQNDQPMKTPITWSAEGGQVDDTGRFTAGNQAGQTFRIQARVQDGKLEAFARIEILPEPKWTVHIQPSAKTVRVGSSTPLTAWVEKNGVREKSSPTEFHFEQEGKQLPGNRFVAPATPGAYQVEVVHPRGRARASFHVIPIPKPLLEWRLEILPSTIKVHPGQIVPFKVRLLEGKREVTINPSQLEFHADSGTFEGSRYHAPKTTGVDRVIIRHPKARGEAQILIVAAAHTPPEKTTPTWELEVRPTAPVLSPGGSVQIETRLFHRGEPATLWPWDIQFEPLDGGSFAGSRFTPPSRPGQYRVRVKHPRTNRLITVTVQGSPATQLTLVPKSLQLEPGESVRFHPRLKDKKGQSIDGRYTWSVSKGAGHIDHDGTFTASQTTGRHTVSVQEVHSRLQAHATVDIVVADAALFRNRGQKWGEYLRLGTRSKEDLTLEMIASLFFRNQQAIDSFRSGFLETYRAPDSRSLFESCWRNVLLEYGRNHGGALLRRECNEEEVIRFLRNCVLRFKADELKSFQEGFAIGFGSNGASVLEALLARARRPR